MNVIIKQAKTENGMLHIKGFVDDREFYINTICEEIISNPQELNETEIQSITMSLYEFETKERICELQ